MYTSIFDPSLSFQSRKYAKAYDDLVVLCNLMMYGIQSHMDIHKISETEYLYTKELGFDKFITEVITNWTTKVQVLIEGFRKQAGKEAFDPGFQMLVEDIIIDIKNHAGDMMYHSYEKIGHEHDFTLKDIDCSIASQMYNTTRLMVYNCQKILDKI